jgi:hypothetical protein
VQVDAGQERPGHDVTSELTRADRFTLAGIGLAQGFVLWAVPTWWPAPGAPRAAAMGAVTFAVVAGLAAQFTWTGRDRVRLLGVAGLTGVWVWLQIPPTSGSATGRSS